MLHRIVSTTVLALFAAGCASGPKKPACPMTQAAVESVAKQYPECVRLTVHSLPPSGGTECNAIASTDANKLGMHSDPEDLKAMKTGEMVLLEEPGALDYTYPIMQKDGTWMAACGVTLKSDAGNRTQLQARAQVIAKDVEAALVKEATQMPAK
jgi:hypothetical protein